MKKKSLLILSAALLCSVLVQAQYTNTHTSGLALELGASVNYYYGLPDRNFGKFENDRVNWQLNGMLGITLARDKSGHRTMIAAFGNFGFNNDNTVTHLLQDQQYTTLATGQSAANNFYGLEGGLLIADMLRISTGVGQQNFNTQTLISSNTTQLNTTHLKYNSSTVGVKLNFRSIAWMLNCNFAYGQDYKKTIIVPSTGLMLRF